ncbi:13475_t:CDS:2, partial [Racocetra persica]
NNDVNETIKHLEENNDVNETIKHLEENNDVNETIKHPEENKEENNDVKQNLSYIEYKYDWVTFFGNKDNRRMCKVRIFGNKDERRRFKKDFKIRDVWDLTKNMAEDLKIRLFKKQDSDKFKADKSLPNEKDDKNTKISSYRCKILKESKGSSHEENIGITFKTSTP